MKKSKFIAVLLVVCLVLGVAGCSSGNGSKEEKKPSGEAKDIEAVKKGVSALKDKKDTYIVQTVIDAPDGDSTYIEVCLGDGDSYTEYPDSTATSSTSKDKDKKGVQYYLGDWISKSDNKMYLVGTSSDSELATYIMPDSYKDLNSGRRVMFADELMSSVTDLKFYRDLDTDVGNGTESFKFYRGTVPSSAIRKILGAGSEGLYNSLKKDNKDNKNLVRFCDLYLKDLDMSLTFSDASVIFGVVDGLLKYVSIEVGGLGTKMYVTKSIVTQEITQREKPDFSKAKSYVETIQETADYIAGFDSDEEAMKALYSARNSATSTESPEPENNKSSKK